MYEEHVYSHYFSFLPMVKHQLKDELRQFILVSCLVHVRLQMTLYSIRLKSNSWLCCIFFGLVLDVLRFLHRRQNIPFPST